jgi:hypothetical protein
MVHRNTAGTVLLQLSLVDRFGTDASSRLPPLLRGVINCLNNLMISGAPAEVARDTNTDVLFTRGMCMIEEILGAHEHPRRAEPAVNSIVIKERFLQRREGLPLRKTFDGRDIPSFDLRCEDQTRIHGDSIQKHCACPTLADLASTLCSSKTKGIAQEI